MRCDCNVYVLFACSGDVHVITLTDSFGFECINRNRMDQLIVNSLNEQLQYHFNQRMFVWEMIEQVCELLPVNRVISLSHSSIVFLFLVNYWHKGRGTDSSHHIPLLR